jgi:hypothetical protein
MQMLKLYSFIFILPVMLLSYTDYLRTGPLQLEGTVTDAITGKPIEKAYLYVLQGNEEILTDEKGHFSLKTWQELPFSLTIEHKDYTTSVMKISEASRTLKLKITRK